MKGKFPSPLGVIFSLIDDFIEFKSDIIEMFPSPLGVIFSLMRGRMDALGIYVGVIVSVSSRSYILSYMLLNILESQGKSFRLLSELYSLLWNNWRVYESFWWRCFRLLSELYSLLYTRKKYFSTRTRNYWVSVSSRSYILSYK